VSGVVKLISIHAVVRAGLGSNNKIINMNGVRVTKIKLVFSRPRQYVSSKLHETASYGAISHPLISLDRCDEMSCNASQLRLESTYSRGLSFLFD
jgi:hypothetical protein